MDLIIEPKKILKILIIVVVILSVVSIAGQIYKYNGGHDRYLVSFFDLDREWNLPTWYASTSLLFCSFLLAIISWIKNKAKDSYRHHWVILCVIFFLLALDEAVQLHEQTITPLREFFGTSGLLFYAWVLPAALFLFVFLIAFSKFIYHLPQKLRWRFLAAGTIFVSGALGMELVGGYYADLYGKETLTYAMIANLEEVLEMIGILVFIDALFNTLKTEALNFQIHFEVTPTPA